MRLKRDESGLAGFLDGFLDAVRCRGVCELSLVDGAFDRALADALSSETGVAFRFMPHRELGDSLILRVALGMAERRGQVSLRDASRVVFTRHVWDARRELLKRRDVEWLDAVAARVVRALDERDDAAKCSPIQWGAAS